MKRDTIIILSSNYRHRANKQLAFEIKKQGYKPVVLDPLKLQLFLSSRNKWDLIYDLYGQKNERIHTGNIKAIIPRVGKGLYYASYIIDQLSKNNGIYTSQTGRGLLSASNKMRSLQLCSEFGLRVPKTLFLKDKANVEHIINKIGLPFICKTLTGSQGAGVSILDSKISAKSVLDTLLKSKTPLIVQEFIDNDKTDIRAIVVGNEVVASQSRKVKNKDEFRSNLSLGGIGKKIELSEDVKEFCIRASKAVGLDVSGVDIMFNKAKDPVIIEVNGNFGWKIQKITSVNIAKKMVDYVIFQSENQIQQTDNSLNVFKDSIYLNNAFSRTYGKKLTYTDRNKNTKTIKVSEISDIYKIIEDTFKIN